MALHSLPTLPTIGGQGFGLPMTAPPPTDEFPRTVDSDQITVDSDEVTVDRE